MQNQQNRSACHLQLHLQLPLTNIPKAIRRKVSRGIISNITNNPSTPLIVQLQDGRPFVCGGLSSSQQQASILQSSIGYTVEFYHHGFNLQGLPINPSFKTLVITTHKGEGK